jgi:HEAT repeat protein
MNLPNQTTSALLGKDNEKARLAAEQIINNADIEAWQCLMENTDVLFSYIKDKAGQRLIKSITGDNLESVIKLFKKHETDWDDYIAEGMSHFADESLNARMLEILQTGTVEEQTYAARYFCYVKDEKAGQALFDASKKYYLPLRNNTAEALGKLGHEESYEFYLNMLKSDDEWEKIEAAQFLSNYGNRDATLPILEAMSNSGMAELLAGEIAMLTDINSLFFEKDEKTRLLALEALDNIISGIPEIWPMGVVLDFKIFECMEALINLAKKDFELEDPLAGKYAQILIKTREKIAMFLENSQYTYDEEKDILAELDEIYHLLMYEEDFFWEHQTQNLYKELAANDPKRKIAALSIISDLSLEESTPHIIRLVLNRNESEAVLSEAISALAKMGKVADIDSDTILDRITDPNLLAYIQDKFANA